MSSKVEALKDTGGAVAIGKTVMFMLIFLLIFFVIYKVFSAFKRGADVLGELGPTTEAEKLEIISSPTYQDNIKWLDSTVGLQAVKNKGFKNIGDYLAKIKTPITTINAAAKQIWDSKFSGTGLGIDEAAIYSAISGLPTKAAVSIMAFQFDQVSVPSPLGLKLNSFLAKYLKVPEMKTVTEIIAKKPEV